MTRISYHTQCLTVTVTYNNRAKDDMCYDYQPIMYVSNEVKKSGFLTPEGLIIDSSRQIKCDSLTQYIQIPKSTKTIIRKKEKSSLVDDKYINFVNFHFISKSENYTHNSILSENIDIILSMHEILNNEINVGSVYNSVSENLNIKSKFLEIKQEIGNIFITLKNNIVLSGRELVVIL